MRAPRFLLSATLCAVTALTALDIAPAAAARGRYRRPAYAVRTTVVLEGGLAAPLGDLGDTYLGTVKGFGAETGYDLGLRVRAAFPSGWAVSPSFHFQDFGDFSALDNYDDPYSVQTSLASYGVDIQRFWETADSPLQPFVSAGLALHHNRYRDETEGSNPSFFETSTNSLAVVLGAGLKIDMLELSASYAINRFSTARFAVSGLPVDYNWDVVAVRVGVGLGPR